MTPYFAYGSNMDESQMARRCPDAHLIGVASLRNHGFFITTNGWASVRPDTSSTVWGLFWKLSRRDIEELDLWEDVAGGLYTKGFRRVVPRKGEPCQALLYIETSHDEGIPRSCYMEQIVASAAKYGLPGDYLDCLRAWLP